MKWTTSYKKSLKLIHQVILWAMVVLMTTTSFSATLVLSKELKQKYTLCENPLEESDKNEGRDSGESEDNLKFNCEFPVKNNLKMSTIVYHNYLYIRYFIGIHGEVPTQPPEHWN